MFPTEKIYADFIPQVLKAIHRNPRLNIIDLKCQLCKRQCQENEMTVYSLEENLQKIHLIRTIMQNIQKTIKIQ